MRYLVSGLVVATAATLVVGASMVPAHAEEGAPSMWVLGDKGFAKRVNPITEMEEDDKDTSKTDNRTNPQFNVANLEAKCTSARADYTADTSGYARAKMYQKFVWQQGTGSNTSSERYFRVDLTAGVECHAAPLRNANVSDERQKAGAASATGSALTLTRSVSNDALVNMDKVTEITDSNILIDTLMTGAGNWYVEGEVSGVSAANSEAVGTPGSIGIGGGSGEEGSIEYLNRACNSEGRGYFKFSQPRPNGRATW